MKQMADEKDIKKEIEIETPEEEPETPAEETETEGRQAAGCHEGEDRRAGG